MEISKEHKRLISRAGFQIMGAIDLLDFIIEDLTDSEELEAIFLLIRVKNIKKELEKEARRINKTLKEAKK